MLAIRQLRFYFVSIFISLPIILSAQGEGNIWYFGDNAGLDFATDPPTVLTDGATLQWEGSASVCDPAGNLLFYTDGITVWNNTHNPMPNGTGLLGGWSASQSAIIIPQPDSSHIYYIFTTPQGIGSYAWSRVDMTKDGGLGDVIVKNTILSSSSSEKLCATIHSNGKDYWVMTNLYGSNQFQAYKVSNAGVSPPVNSFEGFTYGGFNFLGCMKFSHDGAMLACALGFSGDFELFDFDATTGIVSNAILLPLFGVSYGLEFSPDDSRLYVTSDTDNGVGQYNLEAGGPAAIAASWVPVNTSSPAKQLSLAPDGNIYVVRYTLGNLDAIQNPDSLGVACNYSSSYLSIFPGQNNLGFPNYPSNYFKPTSTIEADIACGEDTTWLTLINPGIADSIIWNFGDPSTTINNIGEGNPVPHTFSTSGIYTVLAVVWSTGNSDSTFLTFEIPEAPIVFLGADSSLCTSDPILLEPILIGGTPLWQDGSTADTFLVNTSGVYWVEISNICGVSRDTVVINFIAPIMVELGDDTGICAFEELILDAGNPGFEYEWQDGFTDQLNVISEPGLYWVIVSDPLTACPGFDSVNVENGQPVVDLGPDLVVPPSTPVVLDAGNPGSTYSWSNGAMSQVISVSDTGSYVITVLSEYGCEDIDTIHIAWQVTSGIEDPSVEIQLMPNPFANYVELLIQGRVGDFELEFYAADGRLVKKQQVLSNSTIVSTHNWAPGLYMGRLLLENKQISTFRLIKQGFINGF
jgi:hypothetical protein